MPKPKPSSTKKSAAIDTAIAAKSRAAATILKRSVCLLLICEKLGNTRRVDLDDVTLEKGEDKESLESAKKSLRLTKTLIDRKEMRPCFAVIDAAKEYMRSIATPGVNIFGPATYLVPRGHVLKAEERLHQFKADLKERVDELVKRWKEIVEKRRQELGPLFDEKQFATEDEVRAAFHLDWRYTSFQSPDQLEEVDKAVAEASREKYDALLSDAYEEVVSHLRASALLVMQELAHKLDKNKDNDPKALHPTALRDLQEFLGRLPVLNITDDDDLLKICAKVGGIAKDLDVDVLRKAPGVREMLLQEAQNAASKIDELIKAPKRGFAFGGVSKAS